jgi:hypothetical protein
MSTNLLDLIFPLIELISTKNDTKSVVLLGFNMKLFFWLLFVAFLLLANCDNWQITSLKRKQKHSTLSNL